MLMRASVTYRRFDLQNGGKSDMKKKKRKKAKAEKDVVSRRPREKEK